MIMVDTSAWIEYLRDTRSTVCEAVDALLGDDLAVCDVIGMEVLAGARDEQRQRAKDHRTDREGQDEQRDAIGVNPARHIRKRNAQPCFFGTELLYGCGKAAGFERAQCAVLEFDHSGKGIIDIDLVQLPIGTGSLGDDVVEHRVDGLGLEPEA